MTRYTWWFLFWTLISFTRATAATAAAAAAAAEEEDVYKILGVSRTATTKEIKSAYRKKALDTHPDKNRGVPPEEAAAAFHKVVHAFEILSDQTSRQRYDRTGRSDQQQQQQQQQQYSWSFTWSRGGRRKRRLKDKFEVKESQSRVLHIVSLEQLETIIVDDDMDTLERNLLICFLTPKLEEHVMDEMVYPYPFAAMSTQGIWWEDLLQTTIVRFHRSNKLTEFFNIPHGDTMTAPIFVFGKRGQKFDSNAEWKRIETNDRHTYDQWVWEQMQVDIEFTNEHDHPVEIYWIHGRNANNKILLQPGDIQFHTTKLSHEWWVRDARVDTHRDCPGRHRLTENSMLITWKITSGEDKQNLIIPLRKCFDLSGHCPFWKHHGECRKNKSFMQQQCPLTCEFCKSDAVEEKGQDEDQGNDEL
jgi:curved DNA-binding protein CbpA